MSVTLVWATPDADALLAEIARVSNPANQSNRATAPALIRYMMREGHWSPFRMAAMCVRVVTTRDIGRQMLRHDLNPQEFSQRYQHVAQAGEPIWREARMQDTKNRQASLPCTDDALAAEWIMRQQAQWDAAIQSYNWAIDNGIAKEVARALLPEGNTPTVMYFSGWIREWLFYCAARRKPDTQQEHREVAVGCWEVLRGACPAVVEAWEGLAAGAKP